MVLALVQPVAAPVEEAVEEKHIGDEMRAEILRRNWSAAHVWADRQRPVEIADVRRVHRG